MYFATITWKPVDQGGKLTQPMQGTYFCTTVLGAEESEQSTWSIQLEFCEANPLQAKLKFLFDYYPKDQVRKGDQLKLFEGAKVVGYANIGDDI